MEETITLGEEDFQILSASYSQYDMEYRLGENTLVANTYRPIDWEKACSLCLESDIVKYPYICSTSEYYLTMKSSMEMIYLVAIDGIGNEDLTNFKNNNNAYILNEGVSNKDISLYSGDTDIANNLDFRKDHEITVCAEASDSFSKDKDTNKIPHYEGYVCDSITLHAKC